MNINTPWHDAFEDAWVQVLGDCPVDMGMWKSAWPHIYGGMVGDWAPRGSTMTSPHGRLALILELVSATLRIHTEVTESGHDGRHLNKNAILCGDYLYTRALQFIPDLENRDLEEMVHRAVVGSSRGRLLRAVDLYIGGFWSRIHESRRKILYPGVLARTALVACIRLDGLAPIPDRDIRRQVGCWLHGGEFPKTHGVPLRVADTLTRWPVSGLDG